jgi:hypothetical protein
VKDFKDIVQKDQQVKLNQVLDTAALKITAKIIILSFHGKKKVILNLKAVTKHFKAF